MYQQASSSTSKGENTTIGVNNKTAADGGDMPPEERREVVLEFLADHSIALPPKAIFRGLKIERGVTFSYRTTQTILSELEEQGLVARVDKAELDKGNIEPIPEDDAGKRAYYMITMSGRREVGDE